VDFSAFRSYKSPEIILSFACSD